LLQFGCLDSSDVVQIMRPPVLLVLLVELHLVHAFDFVTVHLLDFGLVFFAESASQPIFVGLEDQVLLDFDLVVPLPRLQQAIFPELRGKLVFVDRRAHYNQLGVPAVVQDLADKTHEKVDVFAAFVHFV